jgi:hypothetical protein
MEHVEKRSKRRDIFNSHLYLRRILRLPGRHPRDPACIPLLAQITFSSCIIKGIRMPWLISCFTEKKTKPLSGVYEVAKGVLKPLRGARYGYATVVAFHKPRRSIKMYVKGLEGTSWPEQCETREWLPCSLIQPTVIIINDYTYHRARSPTGTEYIFLFQTV